MNTPFQRPTAAAAPLDPKLLEEIEHYLTRFLRPQSAAQLAAKGPAGQSTDFPIFPRVRMFLMSRFCRRLRRDRVSNSLARQIRTLPKI
jgi:hypothetical protein